jgi:hypothetical protein
MTYKQTQTWKISAPVRHDGEFVGWYASRDLAQRVIDTAGYLQ